MSSPRTFEDYSQRAQALSLPSKLFIDGRYRDAVSGKTFPCVNPGTGKVIAEIAEGDDADVELAVAAARRAFNAGHWSRMAPKERKKILIRLADLIEKHGEELAILETIDMGKPIGDSLSVDIPSSANAIRWNGEACDKIYDEIAPTGPGALGAVTREAIGVVGAVVPWNFPLLMAMWKLGPALAGGNSVVLKPAEQSPLTALRIGELAMEAGLPEGVLNVVSGFGPTAGRALGLHDDVDCIAFTGSGEVGKLFLQYAGQSNMKRVWLECGGKSPNIVFADCDDLDNAARQAAIGIFYNQGEVCTAASRLLVQDTIKDAFMEKVLATAQAMHPGDPLDPATRMGAMVEEGHMKRVLDYIEIGKDEGARLLCGGERVLHNSGGFYIAPTVFDNVVNTMRIAREEIFGPVLSTLTFRDEEEALAIANDTTFGLAAGLWTSNLKRAHAVARRLRAGSVWVNCWDGGDMTMPFGGYKQSGNGRDKSLHALDKYTEIKATWFDFGEG
ncbi:aldehyde dehydrogenase [Varunaivibrio sulfuroxidans]|uniref:Gamma-glutamyl-gamma-aminobutyraldehyde dehydrogenase n=1 Tax=Varunaivibrio sulfuroxidans TaxID=1773489 RepID=A0A4R3JE88_9PROT|nr:aldehyde dehydrogenase [Varunaivibrio sulfuroxidans]TCS63406.1 gamma-glutamyl-gamma-aminobutyraldehyde dehydrogenase [Varunaivibrio sulfuroxidans]WES30448.1 aldehyde dehydrogenase [Varunaivibrio sulfuroxidans]